MIRPMPAVLSLLLSAQVLAAPPSEPAAEAKQEAGEPWTLAVAPRLGVNVPTSKLGVFPILGLNVEYVLPVLERQLSVALDTTFTRPTFTAGGSDARVGGPFTYEVAEREFKFALDALYRMPVGPVGAFFGGGPVLQLLNTTQTTSFGPGENTESNVELGFELAGGADYRLGPGFLFGDLRLVFTDLDHQLTGDTNAGKITVAAGYRFVF